MPQDDSSEYFSEDSPSQLQGDATRLEMERTARDLSARLARQGERVLNEDGFDDDGLFEDDEAALRWRRALLRLSETFLDAAEERRDLSPILLGALHNALEQLLIHGEEDDLMALEEWLGHEAPVAEGDGSTPGEARNGDFLMAGINGTYNGEDQRVRSDRRSRNERRQAERRQVGFLPRNSRAG